MHPKIVLSTTDFERLEALADSLPATESRARDALLGELARADVVALDELPAEVVTMNSTVRFMIESTGEVLQRTLAYPHEAAKGSDMISVLSPVGTALLGMTAGASIQWETPGLGLVGVKILDIVR